MLPSVVRKRFQAINSLACITVVITYVTLPSATSICPSETVSHSQKILRFTARSMTCCRFVRGGMQTLISATLAPKNQFLAVIFDLVWKLLVLWCGKLNKSFDHQQSRASEGPHCPRTSAGKKLPGTPCAGAQVRKDAACHWPMRRERRTPGASALKSHSLCAPGDTQARAWTSLQDSA